ncbi:MAG: hypothetical protein H0T51_18405 [Pirellulales bacterium]|nr:hypothetical protein [Pirellulales bacterium]
MKRLRNLFSLSPGVLAATLLAPTLTRAALFSDNFDVNSSGLYTVNADPDTTVAFAYDYSADGIPSAPGSVGGSTLGVKFTANNGDATATAAAINISPTGQSFTGDYVLRFHSWLNSNGPFPDGGTGSTEFFTAGVGTDGDDVQKSSGSASGAWFAGDSEGGSGIDFRAYLNATLQGPTSTVYTAPDSGTINRRNANNPYYHTTFPGGQTPPASQTAANPAVQTGALKLGTLGFEWREVEIANVGGDVTWTIDGLLIAMFTAPVLTGSNVFVGHWDVFASIAANPEFSFGIVDNLVVEQLVVTPTEDADFDGDGDVDGADFLTWQRGLGAAGDLADGDADGDMFVDGDDLVIWREQFGPGAATPAVGAVPEPSTWAMAALACAGCLTMAAQSRRVGLVRAMVGG